tara:strand:+ start:260 stop:379 length:120 start_codon:yes stop_codon:yes gene_type:complete
VALSKSLPKGAHWNHEDQQAFIFNFYKKVFEKLKKSLLS